MPALSSSPWVGFSATTPLTLPGRMMEPWVSVPTASGARPVATATAEPVLEPSGSKGPKGWWVWPPTTLKPLGMDGSMKLAHSERLVLPRITAPLSRSRATTVASRLGSQSRRAWLPALVASPRVAMLSLISTGTPCSGPRTSPRARSRSRCRAISSARGFRRSTLFSPSTSNSRMRARLWRINVSAPSSPAAMRACSSATGRVWRSAWADASRSASAGAKGAGSRLCLPV